MTIVVCKSGVSPEVREIGREDLTAMQEIVGGWIEVVYLSPVLCLVCNDEGAINGMPLNRIILNERIDGSPLGALNIHGDFFVCQYDGPDMTSIPESRLDMITEAMANPIIHLDAAWHRDYQSYYLTTQRKVKYLRSKSVLNSKYGMFVSRTINDDDGDNVYVDTDSITGRDDIS